MSRWFKYSLLAQISYEMEKKDYKLGKTGVQKLIYLLKSIYNIPIDYSYELYIYGPYSSEIAGDLEYLDSANVLDISFEDYGGYRGYNIVTDEEINKILEKGKSEIKKYKDKISKVVEKFGDKNARELELVGTLVYLKFEEKVSDEDLMDRITDIKPHFSDEEIEEGMAEMTKVGL